MDATTISFDFDANLPSVSLSLELQQSSPPRRIVTSHHDVSMLDDSTSSASVVFISPNRDDDILCEPLFATPEPTLSPCVFNSALLPTSPISPISSNENFAYSNCSNSSTIVNYDTYIQTTTPVSLLPQMFAPISNNVDYDNEILITQDLVPLSSISIRYIHPSDLHLTLPALELDFMNNHTYEYFIHQAPIEIEVITDLSPYDGCEETLIYTQL